MFNIVPVPAILPSLWTSHEPRGIFCTAKPVNLASNEEKIKGFLSKSGEKATRFTIHDRLDAVKYYHGSKHQAPTEQKWAVYFPANGATYESFLDYTETMATALKANVLYINYRGVGASTGYPNSSLDLVEDGASALSHLIDTGVKIENILVVGQSIGAGIGAELLARPSYQKGNLFADRTFSRLPDVAENFFSKGILGSAANSVASNSLTNGGWIFDNVANIKKIKGAKIVLNTERDGMIKPEASLAGKLKKSDADILQLTPRRDLDYTPTGMEYHVNYLFDHEDYSIFTNRDAAIKKAYDALHPAPPKGQERGEQSAGLRDNYRPVQFPFPELPSGEGAVGYARVFPENEKRTSLQMEEQGVIIPFWNEGERISPPPCQLIDEGKDD